MERFIQIEESRFLQLARFEEELNLLFESLVRHYCKEWCALNPDKKFGHWDNKTEVSTYIDNRLAENSIIFNGVTPDVWFDSSTASMYYISTKDRRLIPGIFEMIKL